ncbi:MAG: cupin domain-containing protein [Gammaproteobacteria bacterium]
MKRATFIGELTARAFLKRYWQKSPRLIRGAYPQLLSPISPAELAGLACETGVESRLVIKTRRKPGWQVRHGPFKARDFRTLPEKNWTLLVQDADKHLPELADFLAHFHFIPTWRIDDLMISFAADGGSVGPHVDAYDVFLLQVQGQRRWSINQKYHVPVAKPGLELSQVCAFKPQHTWLLKPGDMLYLPPGVAHHGIAEGECMTFSIGFRTPTDGELLADLSSLLLTRLDKKMRYTDPDLVSAETTPGLISKKARTAIRKRIRSTTRLKPGELDEWFGCFITEPKPWLAPAPARRPLTSSALRTRLFRHKKLARDPAGNMAWYKTESRHIKLFINGTCHILPVGLADFALMLCGQRIYNVSMLARWLRNRHATNVLAELYNQGLLYFP